MNQIRKKNVLYNFLLKKSVPRKQLFSNYCFRTFLKKKKSKNVKAKFVFFKKKKDKKFKNHVFFFNRNRFEKKPICRFGVTGQEEKKIRKGIVKEGHGVGEGKWGKHVRKEWIGKKKKKGEGGVCGSVLPRCAQLEPTNKPIAHQTKLSIT